jgi:hypothetical protein
LTGHTNSVPFVAFRPDGLMLASGSWDASMRLWEVATGKQLARLVALDEKDWAVVDPDGRFDASPRGMEFMHWVVGLEPIALDQLKQRYYEPGLLPKLLGFNKEPLRDVRAFTSVALVPEVETLGLVDESGKLRIRLKNRGGGIGRVQVFVNGKELLADARGPKFDPAVQEATLTIDLRGGPSIMRGKENKISIVAWNQEGYLRSRDNGNLGWKPPGKADDRDPELYAIVVGTAKYAAENLQLNFAAKDAEDMARAFELAGKRLFGADHVHLSLFSTSGNPRVLPPTKANVKRAFEQAQTGGPNDVLLVYLAGHGTTQKDLYVYLTQDSTGRDLYDPAILEQTTITSDELAEWIKKVPARHQVLILDTCGAGAVATKLLEKRDVPSDQIRALDTLKDRTGFHVLMGAAADAVSYEASQYGQGLLTYTLLQGMRGAALKDDTEVDVSKLFRYAEDHVPEMARNIGGIQKPQVIEPRVGQSFPVGRLLAQDKKDIPLALVKPLLLRPVALNPKDVGDTLHLQDALRKRLREENYVSTRGGEPRQPAAVFVDEEEFPGAFQPKALYTVEGKQVHLTLVLWRDGQKEATLQEDGSTDNLPGFVEKIAQDIIQTVRRAQPPPPSPS